MKKISKKMLEYIVEHSTSEKFYSLTYSKEMEEVFGGSLGYNADHHAESVYYIMFQIIINQEYDRGIRMQLAKNYFANATFDAYFELLSSDEQHEDKRNPTTTKGNDESWRNLDEVGLKLFWMNYAIEMIEKYLDIESLLYLYHEYERIGNSKDEESFIRTYFNMLAYKAVGNEIEIEEHFTMVENNEDILGKNSRSLPQSAE